MREWWANKEREIREADQTREKRWATFRSEHPDADLEALLVEFRKSEAVRFTLENR